MIPKEILFPKVNSEKSAIRFRDVRDAFKTLWVSPIDIELYTHKPTNTLHPIHSRTNSMSDPNDWNAGVIAEFRKNHGKVGGYFKGAPLLLLHHTGARSGKARLNPMMYLKDGDRYLVFASKGGADTNPDWYYNMTEHPDVQIEVGDETIDVRAEEITGPERNTMYERQASIYPTFAQYQLKTKRTIPVIALVPKSRRK